MTQITSNIELLPEHIIDQIKAGEVVERPASLIKEIIENSIDAGSTHIEIQIVGEGMDLISIKDNGHGMSFPDLPYAFCRHATSKISRFEDLYRLHTFGFRGEALASISAISKISCTSTPKSKELVGGKITLEAGHVTSHSEETTGSPGTSIYIKDLFYNTPARLKFIKSANTEKNAIKRIIESFIISNPSITFSIRWEEQDKDIYQAVSTQDLEKRVKQLFYKNKTNQEIYTIEKEYEGHKVVGFFSNESVRSHNARKQFLFANQRLFIDKQIHQLVTRSMESRGWHNGAGSYCLFIQTPPSQIDVNVHPNKTYIKFLKHSLILSLISSEIKDKCQKVEQLENNDLGIESSVSLSPQSSTPLSHYINSPYQNNHEPRPMRDLFHEKEAKPLINHTMYQVWNDNNDEIFLIHRPNITALLFQYIQESDMDDESETIPLLISEPLSNTYSKEDLVTLRKFGFIVEKINDNLFAVRAVHKLLISLPYDAIIAAIKLSEFKLSDSYQFPILIPTSLLNNLEQISFFNKKKECYLLSFKNQSLTNLFSKI
jgi:DNA mismatch repair protein MutL